MMTLRPASERGRMQTSWLDSYFSFSFADYYDPRHMGQGPLRVINEDFIAPEGGFPLHGHQDMEIITYVLEGSVAHRDSLGNVTTIAAGDVQCMTAGKGIRHSEYNPSRSLPLHLLQIWIIPDKKGYQPRYEQKQFPAETKQGRLCLAVSESGRDGSLKIHRDVDLYLSRLEKGDVVSYDLAPQRDVWVQVAYGAVLVNGRQLQKGDGAALEGETAVRVEGTEASEILVFDLPH